MQTADPQQPLKETLKVLMVLFKCKKSAEEITCIHV